eukprot:1670072-Alexandrium_andersonii.AAC.1
MRTRMLRNAAVTCCFKLRERGWATALIPAPNIRRLVPHFGLMHAATVLPRRAGDGPMVPDRGKGGVRSPSSRRID